MSNFIRGEVKYFVKRKSSVLLFVRTLEYFLTYLVHKSVVTSIHFGQVQFLTSDLNYCADKSLGQGTCDLG